MEHKRVISITASIEKLSRFVADFAVCEEFVSSEARGFFTFPKNKADKCAFQITLPADKKVKLTCKNVDKATFDSFEVSIG